MLNDDPLFVRLFSQAGPRGNVAYWNSKLDWMVYEPRDVSVRARSISPFVDIHESSEQDMGIEMKGFKLARFSVAMSLLAEWQGWKRSDRVALSAILQYYRGVCLGASVDPIHPQEAVDKELVELIRLCGYATILQPEYARTVKL
jgi:hypothetical protein